MGYKNSTFMEKDLTTKTEVHVIVAPYYRDGNAIYKFSSGIRLTLDFDYLGP